MFTPDGLLFFSPAKLQTQGTCTTTRKFYHVAADPPLACNELQ